MNEQDLKLIEEAEKKTPMDFFDVYEMKAKAISQQAKDRLDMIARRLYRIEEYFA